MASVTRRIKEIKQPQGGYLQPSEFQRIEFEDGNTLKEENIPASLVGMVVDYLTRYMLGIPKEEAFSVSLAGARIIDDSKHASKLFRKIKGLDDKSIYSACQLVGYDVCFRAGPMNYKDVRTIDANYDTINNIRIMVGRSLDFFDEYGPIVLDGFTFEGGYTNTIDSGDGDFLTNDTLWDFKVSSAPPKPAHTLQVLIYYLMGKHSVYEEFDNIENLGIFNPRLNCAFLKRVEEIPEDTIKIVSNEVIGYKNKAGKMVSSDNLTIADIMQELQCTRYAVMKYYTESGLPLKKINNKYYIKELEFYGWLIEMEEEQKKRRRNAFIFSAIAVLITAIILIFTLKQH